MRKNLIRSSLNSSSSISHSHAKLCPGNAHLLPGTNRWFPSFTSSPCLRMSKSGVTTWTGRSVRVRESPREEKRPSTLLSPIDTFAHMASCFFFFLFVKVCVYVKVSSPAQFLSRFLFPLAKVLISQPRDQRRSLAISQREPLIPHRSTRDTAAPRTPREAPQSSSRSSRVRE